MSWINQCPTLFFINNQKDYFCNSGFIIVLLDMNFWCILVRRNKQSWSYFPKFWTNLSWNCNALQSTILLISRVGHHCCFSSDNRIEWASCVEKYTLQSHFQVKIQTVWSENIRKKLGYFYNFLIFAFEHAEVKCLKFCKILQGRLVTSIVI